MENFIDYISISNFKSIRELRLEGLNRINLFIGKPNVGKSNILEAFGMFSLPYMRFYQSPKISNLIRGENRTELFFDGITNNNLSISTNLGTCIGSIDVDKLDSKTNSPILEILIRDELSDSDMVFNVISDLSFSLKAGHYYSSKIKNYIFKTGLKLRRTIFPYLIPPFGNNLLETISELPTLKSEINTLFNEYKLNVIYDIASKEIKIAKPPKNGEIFLIPFSSVADTLQRLVFYKTAIASNKNSVLIFEEPEAHAFPPYISHITQDIIDSKSNQFILSTHSPYVVNEFLEDARDELAIFMVDYKNGETVANKLTRKNLDDIYSHGIDLFTNYEMFLK